MSTIENAPNQAPRKLWGRRESLRDHDLRVAKMAEENGDPDLAKFLRERAEQPGRDTEWGSKVGRISLRQILGRGSKG